MTAWTDTVSCAPTQRNPLLLWSVEVPPGAPEGRLAELVAMAHRDHVPAATAFEQPVPRLGMRLGADGIGGRIARRRRKPPCWKGWMGLRTRPLPPMRGCASAKAPRWASSRWTGGRRCRPCPWTPWPEISSPGQIA